MMPVPFSVGDAERWALERAAGLPADPFRLIAFWSVRFLVQATPDERKTCYSMKIAQAETYGRSGGLGPIADPDPDLVGEDARLILQDARWKDEGDRLAVVDSVIGAVSRPPDAQVVLDETAQAKYVARAELFADEVERTLRGRDVKPSRRTPPRVLVVGASAGIIGALVRRGYDVAATDLSAEVVGRRLAGVLVQDGKLANARLLSEADLAILTALTLVNGTLPELMRLAKAHRVATMIWAVTARNFGHYYVEHGVDSVISDPAPFLLLPGPAAIRIWRRLD
jgi:hypothetical protein